MILFELPPRPSGTPPKQGGEFGEFFATLNSEKPSNKPA